MERVNPRSGRLELLVEKPKRSKPLPKDLTSAQVHQLLESCRGANARRDRLLILLAVDTGLRFAEIAELHKEDVGPTIPVPGKGRKTRDVPVSTEVLSGLLFLGTADLPWVDQAGYPLSRDGIKAAYRRIFSRAGIKAGPHALRHTFATSYLRRGGDLYRLSRILGHADTKITEVYLHLVNQDLIEEHHRVSPAGEFITAMRRLL